MATTFRRRCAGEGRGTVRWAAYDLPGDWLELKEGHGPETVGDGFKQAINDLGKPGYAGPRPPEGHGLHHYHFRLMALSEPTGGFRRQLCRGRGGCRTPRLRRGELVGTYER